MIPTFRGILLLLMAAPVMALGTWLQPLTLTSWLYALMIVCLWVLDWRLAGTSNRFEVTRKHDTKLSLGADNPIFLFVRDLQGHATTIWVRDEAPEALPIDQHILHGNISARGEWKGIYHLRPQRRGDYQFGDIYLRWRGPLGLIVRQGKVKAAGPVKVYPNLLDVRRYDLLLRRNRLQEMGLRHARMLGEGTEFERLREYLPDDEYRRIDWKATARRHRPVTVEYQTERSQNIMAVLDTGRMMQTPVADMAKLDYVVNAVLLLAYVATGKGDKVGMMSFAGDVERYLSPKQGRGQFYRMLELLYGVQARPVEPDYRKALGYLGLKQRKRTLIVLFTDLSSGSGVEALTRYVSPLAHSSLPLVVTISDPQVHAAASHRPNDSQSVYQRAVAAQLLEERRKTLEMLHRQGVLTLDVPANQLSAAVINRYLELKGRTAL